MGVSILSQEQISILRDSPYVASITARQVSFTKEFKQHFYEEYMNGNTPKKILKDMKIDPEVLGESRVVSATVHALRQAKSANGFTDRKSQWGADAAKRRARTTEERVSKLEHELAYTKQELEFVKKILLAEREAQREWQLKQRQMSNSQSFEK